MNEEVVRITCASVLILTRIRSMSEGVLSCMMSAGGGVFMTIGEDDNFVNAEDGEGARYVACHCGTEFVGLGTGRVS